MEAPLFSQGIDGDSLGWAGYEAVTALAEDNLSLGLGVVLDSVGWTRQLRGRWADIAESHALPFRPIEVTCSDPRMHRQRIETRNRSSRSGWANPDWASVQSRRSLYEPWDQPRLVLDSVLPLDEMVTTALAYVRS